MRGNFAAKLDPEGAYVKELSTYIDRLEVAFSSIMRQLGPELAKAKEPALTVQQFFILNLLSQKESWMVTELAERLVVKPSAVTAMIDRLHQNGLAERIRDESDRRVVFVRLTDLGRIRLQEAKAARRRVISKYLSQFTKEELETLVHLYEKMRLIVERGDESGSN
jgi:DNA-binding MarR family transcriptional regulator